MFTGLVEALGTVRQIVRQPPGVRLSLAAGLLNPSLPVGASVAINGCCLTVVANRGDEWDFDVGPETLSRTNLGRLSPGSRVNLERSLKVGDPLGGHLVSGHIDGLGIVLQRQDELDWSTLWFTFPEFVAPQLASKGSITVDGVSLTLVDVARDRFSVQLIPHTLQETTLGACQVGDMVNLESDLLAKYVAAQLAYLRKQT